jgi:DNA-directed RNA polymerase
MKDITEFTGLDLLKIDIANTYGLDKELYQDRIDWATEYLASPIELKGISEPLMFKKAVLAYEEAINTGTTNHNMFMDATSSGIQILAALSNCRASGIASNLVFNGKRNDAYTMVTDKMLEYLPNSDLLKGLTKAEARDLFKKPIMVFFYNGITSVEELLGKDSPELDTFYNVLQELFPGAIATKDIINGQWNEHALHHTFTLPDGHVAHIKVIDKVITKIQVPELQAQNSFKYTAYFNQPSKKGTSLCPNLVHSIDAYIVRQVILRSEFQVAHIHDAFTAHPSNMAKVMDLYRTILAEIADSDLLQDILAEISKEPVKIQKYKYDLANDIRKSQYSLC